MATQVVLAKRPGRKSKKEASNATTQEEEIEDDEDEEESENIQVSFKALLSKWHRASLNGLLCHGVSEFRR